MLRRAVLSRFGVGALAGGLGSGVLGACAPGGPGGGGAGEAPRPGTAASGAVSWMYSANPATSGFDRIEAAFKARYPQVTLDVQHAPDDYDNKLLALYSAGNPPDSLPRPHGRRLPCSAAPAHPPGVPSAPANLPRWLRRVAIYDR